MNNDDLIRRGDAIAACAVGPSDEWARATKSGYMQAATDCTFNVLRIPAAVSRAQRAALSASQPADPVTNAACCQPVKVKPLEWRNSYGVLRAKTLFGDYIITRHILKLLSGSEQVHDDTEAAKAAAQADYEGRVLAALEPASVTPAEAAKGPKVQALVKAARKLAENLGVKGVDVGSLRVDLYRALAAFEKHGEAS